MRKFKTLVTALFLLGLSACATVTPDLTVSQGFWNSKQETIGVAVAEIPAATAHKGGTQGLLDIAINNAVAGDLEKHLSSLDTKDVVGVAKEITDYLGSNGYNAIQFKEEFSIADLPDFKGSGGAHFAAKDFTSYKTKYNIDKLVLITVVRIGTVRNYYGFIPISEPSGLSHLNGQVINLSNNSLEWNHTIVQQVPNMTGDWDAPPNYPGLTKAMYAALSQSKKALFNSFVR